MGLHTVSIACVLNDVPHPWLKGVRKLVIMKRCTPGEKQVLVLISIIFFGISLLTAADDNPTNDPASSPELKQIAQIDESFDTLIEQRKAAEVAEIGRASCRERV